MITGYELSPATSAEAEMLNDKIDAFNVQQVSFHGNVEVLKDYVIKNNGLIIAGIILHGTAEPTSGDVLYARDITFGFDSGHFDESIC